MFKDYRKESRANWGAELDADKNPTNDQLKLGCLLRIADGIELMARNYAMLLTERDNAVEARNRAWREQAKLERSNSALRGHLTRAKRRA